MILAMLKMLLRRRKKEMRTGGWNNQRGASFTQPYHGPVDEAMDKKVICPSGLNLKREANNNQHDLGAIYKKEMIIGGWNSQREVCNTKHYIILNNGILK